MRQESTFIAVMFEIAAYKEPLYRNLTSDHVESHLVSLPAGHQPPALKIIAIGESYITPILIKNLDRVATSLVSGTSHDTTLRKTSSDKSSDPMCYFYDELAGIKSVTVDEAHQIVANASTGDKHVHQAVVVLIPSPEAPLTERTWTMFDYALRLPKRFSYEVAYVVAAAEQIFTDRDKAISWYSNEPLWEFDGGTAEALVAEGKSQVVIDYLASIANGAN